jgi:hypothetical protein
MEETNKKNKKLKCNLEKSHFISQLITYVDTRTDAYGEYIHMGGVFLLSTAADRKIVIPLNFGTVYTNLYCQGLGKPGQSRKSTAISFIERLAVENFPDKALSVDFTPEAFIETMSDRANRFHILDEAGGLLSSLTKKSYMAGFKDTLMKIYDCQNHRRTLRTSQRKDHKTDFQVREPYVNLLWATTFDRFNKTVSEGDVASGLLSRFLFYAPMYDKEFLEVSTETDNMGDGLYEIGNRLRKILSAMEKIDGVIKFIPSKNAFATFNEWDKRIQKSIAENSESTPDGTVHARMATMIWKLAALYYLGSERFLSDIEKINPQAQGNLEVIRQKVSGTMNLPEEYFMEAFNNVLDYFSPVSIGILTDISDVSSENIQVRILAFLRQSGGRAKENDVLRKLKIKSKELGEHLQALVDSEQIKRTEIMDLQNPNDKRRVTIWLELIATEGEE